MGGDIKNDKKYHLMYKNSLKNTTNIDFGRYTDWILLERLFLVLFE